MKILWVNPNFLHPTTKGGHIRTLGMLRELHKRHEIHYVAFASKEPEALASAHEYSTKAYAIPHAVPNRRSVGFLKQMIGNLLSTMPLPVERYYSPEKARVIRELRDKENFDAVVCDFLFPAPNFDSFDDVILFQHNVETMIWRRHVETARNTVERIYFRVQADRMERYERQVCSQVQHTVAVSAIDAEKMRRMFSVDNISDIGTGVDIDYFTPPPVAAPVADLVFVGSMDWMPNIDGVTYFADEIFPLIRRERPDCRVAIVGRTPPPDIVKLAERDKNVIVTGTVPDVRPYLWGSKVSIVPLRIGSGTRLKIYEAMAARIAVVSTTIGAEGLQVNAPSDIRLADTPAEFARECLKLLADGEECRRVATTGRELVATKFSWAQITRDFEGILEAHAATSKPLRAGL
jgi:glycosyltransferase involved in cell wall biosynthesis